MRALLVAILVLGGGCGPGVSPVVAEADPLCPPPLLSAQAQLEAAPVVFELQSQVSVGSFTARRPLWDVESTRVPLAVRSGRLVATAGSEGAGFVVQLTEYRAQLEDIVLPAQLLPPAGLTLTDAWFAVRGPVTLPVRWLGNGAVGLAMGPVPIELHTALLRANGQASPLEVGVLPAVPLELVVQRGAGGVLLLSADAHLEGTLWRWAGLFELGDVHFTAEAHEEGSLIERPFVPAPASAQLR